MNIPLGWVSLFCDVNPLFKKYTTEELAHLFSVHTAEIDDVHFFGNDGVKVGKVLSAKAHPESDHLNIVSVDLGAGPVQIVCGAANVREAKYVPVAVVGCRILGHVITQAKLRGEESNGMICSADELEITDARNEHDGILKLEDHFDVATLEQHIGKPFFDLEISLPGLHGKAFKCPMKGITFEIDNKFITNRPDLFSVEGNAREFGAVFGLDVETYAFDENVKDKEGTGVELATDKVSAYILDVYTNLDVAPSPLGIQVMMKQAGMPTKMDIVDATNYIITELGQPMHAFDADKIDGHIIVRMAKDGEEIKALNGETYKLCKDDIVIADEKKALAIAWVMGGMESAISATTKRIAVESACFDPVSIRLTAKRVGIRTDASMRYEKSLDPLLTFKGARRMQDILQFLGKKAVHESRSYQIHKNQLLSPVIDCTYEAINKKIGLEIPKENTLLILKKLGFVIVSENATGFSVRVPSWRATKDVSIKEDIAEEVGRVYGYDKVAETPLTGPFVPIAHQPRLVFRDLSKTYFASRGLYEVYNYSFASLEEDEMIGLNPKTQAIEVVNSANQEYSHMRRSLFVRLLRNCQIFAQTKDKFGLFEWGKTFIKNKENDFSEYQSACGVFVGYSEDEAKSILEGAFALYTHGKKRVYGQLNAALAPDCFHSAQTGFLGVDDQTPLITFGYIHPKAKGAIELLEDVLLFSVDVEKCQAIWEESNYLMEEFSKFPFIPRELNFVIDESTLIFPVMEMIEKVDARIRSIGVVDVFKDEKKVGAGKQSVTFKFILQDDEKTIADEEALKIQDKIIATLQSAGHRLRSN